MTIEEFIEARIAEREASLEQAYGGRYRSEGYLAERLREHAAMRVILDLHAVVEARRFGDKKPVRARCAADCQRAPCDTLRALAAAWRDHEDYDKEWKP